MTRKDYWLIANVVRSARLSDEMDRYNLAVQFADELTKGNPRFDRAVFLRACNPNVT